MTQSDATTSSRLEGIAARTGLTLVGSVGGGALVFLNEAIVAKLLGAGAYGLYALAFALVSVSQTLALFGLRAAVVHFIPVFRSRDDAGGVGGTILGGVAVPVAFGGLLTIVLTLLAPWFSRDVLDEPGAEATIRVFAAAVPLMALSWMASAVSWGFGKAGTYVLIRMLVYPLSFLALLAIIALVGADAALVPFSFVLAHALAAVTGLFILWRLAAPAFRRARPRLELRHLFAYSAPVLLSTLFYMVLTWTDLLMLGAFVEPKDVGTYRACVLPTLLMGMIPRAINSSTSSVYPVLADQKHTEDLSRVHGSATRWMTALCALTAALIFLSRRDVLGLLGPAFPGGARVMAILVVANAIKDSLANAGSLLVVTGNQRLETVNAGLAAGLNIALNLWLIPRHGMLGAATGTAVSLLAIGLLRAFEVPWRFGFSTVRAGALRIAALVIAGTAGLHLLSGSIGLGDGVGLPALCVRIPLSALALAAILWHWGLAPEDREQLSQLARRVGAPRAPSLRRGR